MLPAWALKKSGGLSFEFGGHNRGRLPLGERWGNAQSIYRLTFASVRSLTQMPRSRLFDQNWPRVPSLHPLTRANGTS